MKDRVTLTLEPSITHRAKLEAKARQMSLSALVESLLERETSSQPEKNSASSFSSRWLGKMKVSRRRDERTARLKKKYQL